MSSQDKRSSRTASTYGGPESGTVVSRVSRNPGNSQYPPPPATDPHHGGDNGTEDAEMYEKLIAPADFNGPTHNRRYTDIPCLLLIVLMWGGLSVIGGYSIATGDYRLVVHPLDYDGNICGTDYVGPNNSIHGGQDMTQYPFLLYVNSMGGGVCVKECPNLSNLSSTTSGNNNNTSSNTNSGGTITADIRTMVTYSGMWQPSDTGDVPPLVPLDFVQVADYSTSNTTTTTSSSTSTSDGSSSSSSSYGCTDATCWPSPDIPQDSWNSQGIRQGFGYAYYVGTTYSLVQRCFLTTQAGISIAEQLNITSDGLLNFSDEYASTYTFLNKLYADIWTAKAYVLGFGFGISFLVSLCYVGLMRVPVLLTAVIWTSILVTIAMFFIGGWYSYKLYLQWASGDPDYDTPTEMIGFGIPLVEIDAFTIRAVEITSYVLWGTGVVLLLLACCLRQQIQLAIVCTKEAGRAVNNMIFILLIPILQACGMILFLIVFVIYAVYLASMGTITVNDFNGIPFRMFEFDDFVKQCGWYLLFALFWTANFIVAMGDLMIALSVAKWYFTKNKSKIGSWTVLSSIIQTILYHAGTCAYGSLLIAIVRLIRWIIYKFQRAAKATNNSIARVVLCCCQCCFCCLEKCLQFISKNAYVHTAIFSTPFNQSCRKSFYLIFRNAGRISAVSYVSAAILIVGKLFISAVTTIFAYYAIVTNLSSELYSVGGPVIIVFLISYWISDMFMDVFDMAILTILLCFIADEEMFDHEDERYAEAGLKQWIDAHGSLEGNR